MILTFKEFVEVFEPTQIKPVRWQMPNIMQERNEVTRQAQEMGLDWRQLMQSIRQARLVPLDDNTWANMQNTESNDPSLSLENLMSWTHRDAPRILQVFQAGGSLPAPIVLVHEGAPICLAGNTRLCVCKVLRVRPQVLMVKA